MSGRGGVGVEGRGWALIDSPVKVSYRSRRISCVSSTMILESSLSSTPHSISRDSQEPRSFSLSSSRKSLGLLGAGTGSSSSRAEMGVGAGWPYTLSTSDTCMSQGGEGERGREADR